jgi:hypothetical protein
MMTTLGRLGNAGAVIGGTMVDAARVEAMVSIAKMASDAGIRFIEK